MTASSPCILIGLDAVEITLVERLLAEGRLPNLAALKARGRHGRLIPKPTGFLSMVWPSFWTSTRLGEHGWFFNKLWRPEAMRLQYVDPDWLPIRPFCTAPSLRDSRLALLDVPFLADSPEGMDGIFLNGWQCHDDFGRRSHPDELWGRLKRRFGSPAMRPELFGPQTGKTLLRQRREALASIEQFARISSTLLAEGSWDLFLTVFGGPHRSTHYLWDLSQINVDRVSPEERRVLENACVEIYQAWDRALGAILEKAPSGARIVAFALHGMGPNLGWTEQFDRVVQRVHSGDGDAPRLGLAYRVKKALPWKLVRQVTTRLPSEVNHALVPLWSRRMHDWSRTRFFLLPADLNGYVRINLRGREAGGIVEPGTEYDALCSELEEAFLSFVDIDSGRPFVAKVERVDGLVEPDAPARRYLPDLQVHWRDLPIHESSGVRSEQYGEVVWGRGYRLPSGRSGNHHDQGWFVAAGPGIRPGPCEHGYETIDLIPTVFEWLGAERPSWFQG
ncbi:MAG: alkaline phosphatase family protein, partial [Gemmatimonadota bacterium]